MTGSWSALGRVHDGAQARAAVQEAAESFETFNLDIMYALPGQTEADVAKDLETALAFQPPHISIYHLTIEPNTYFAKFPPVVPEDDTAYDMLDRITAMTGAAGMQRYEISAYARAGHQCFHNTNYWQFGDYLGIGAGAHGKLSFAHRMVRQVKLRDPQRYMDAALAGRALASDDDVRRKDLPFEVHAQRAAPARRVCPAGLPGPHRPAHQHHQPGFGRSASARAWCCAAARRIVPTERGFDFLSDLQELFLATPERTGAPLRPGLRNTQKESTLRRCFLVFRAIRC